MRILHIYKDYFPVLGGIENHVRMLAEGQAARGHDVTVLVCRRGIRTQVETLNRVQLVRTSRIATLASMPISLSLPLAVSRLQPEIAHLHSPFPLGEVSNWLLGRARATVVTHHSDIVQQRIGLILYAPLLDRILRSADTVIATSKQYLETSRWLSRVRNRCVVVPLGVDPDRFRGCARHVDGRATSLLFVGRLRYYKGLETLFRALLLLPEARLSVVGEGPMGARWKRLAAGLGLSDRVRFLGEVPDGDLAEHYATADLFVLPSSARAEAFGTVLLEAMAAALPVISTELGTGTSWVNRDGVTGRVVPPEHPDELARAIRELLPNKGLRERMGEAARARVLAEFTRDAMIGRIHQVYETVLDQRTTPSSSPWVTVG